MTDVDDYAHFPHLLPATYRPAALLECRGNPLIEALPPLRSGEEMVPVFGRRPPFDRSERSLSATERMLCVSRLNNYLFMMPAHETIVEQLGLLIHGGYMYRNPAQPDFKKALVEFYRQSMDGKLQPIETSGPSTAPSFSLFGVSGAGKSTVLERALSFYPRAIQHPVHGILQLVWLKVDCPPDGSLKQLLLAIIVQIDAILGTSHMDEINRSDPIDKLIFDVARVAALHHLGALVVDEIQHLLDAPGVGPAKMLNFFVTFANEVKIPFVVLGTPKAKRMLGTLLREARRLSDQGSYEWDRMKQDEDWDLFLNALWKYQWLKQAGALTPEVSEAMYDQTQGVSALVVRLFQLSQWHAIRSKSESITASLINHVAKEQFKLLQDFITALRSGDREAAGRFEDIYQAEIKKLNNVTHLNYIDPKLEETATNKLRKRFVSNLIYGGCEPSEASGLAEKIFSNPRLETIQTKQLAGLTKRARSLETIDGLITTVAIAQAGRQDPIEALEAAGYFADMEDGVA
ncbi:AAA family ATPase [Bradyrhizobium sp. Bra64]|uniref:AAA family ATPase n=1 Tax=Bradyrhizobium sp. Bra64 TaxID=2926009 RepID=UPI00211915B4|nr:AAA family ATPase [Bradyrhizobium sp. Bra64]